MKDSAAKSATSQICKTLSLSVKSQPHKQHIWFFPDTKANAKKPKELFFANARTDKRVEKSNLDD